MKKFLMIASAAAMAVTMPALAKPDKGNGGGGNHAAHQGGGKGKPERTKGNEFKGNRGSGNGFKEAGKQAEKAQKQQFKAAQKSFENRNKAAERAIKAENKRAERFAKQQEKASERYSKAQEKAMERRFENRRSDDRRFDDRRFEDRDRFENARFANDGRFCPPGLARKNNGCMPPGQAMKALAVGQQFQSNWYPQYNLPQDYRDVYSDNSEYYYRYDDDGYIYRVDRDSDLVSGLIPLLGGGFGVGQTLPAGYDIYNVPFQYRDTYYDTDDSYYRYGDNAIYQVDPQTQMIESVVALLTGDSFGVGQTLPAGYDMYNLPMQYRDQYYDTDEYNYRYADGNIYQVDPQTQIIQAIVSALV